MKIDLSTSFWLFFILIALQPVLKKRLLLATRQRLIAKLEKIRGSRVILLIHRQETMNLLGFPILRYIDIDDSEAVIRAIHMTDPVCRVLQPKAVKEKKLVRRKSPAGKRQRRLFVLFLSGFLLLSFPKAWGADWKHIGETPKASYYYDAEDMVRQEKVVRVWVRAVYSPEGRRMEAEKLGTDISNLTDSGALEEINCRDKDYRAVTVVVYTMEKKVVISDFKERGLDFILPDSIWEGLYKTLCR